MKRFYYPYTCSTRKVPLNDSGLDCVRVESPPRSYINCYKLFIQQSFTSFLLEVETNDDDTSKVKISGCKVHHHSVRVRSSLREPVSIDDSNTSPFIFTDICQLGPTTSLNFNSFRRHGGVKLIRLSSSRLV